MLALVALPCHKMSHVRTATALSRRRCRGWIRYWDGLGWGRRGRQTTGLHASCSTAVLAPGPGRLLAGGACMDLAGARVCLPVWTFDSDRAGNTYDTRGMQQQWCFFCAWDSMDPTTPSY